ncbi:uncharacterized protein LOC124696835 [Lolium rigidum]|uniref:uncharacterized protein LOC124696835 n=1 Tax=Lolium rigidum TaxID=89674 RepID=UPI001F5C7633|nr:uncharacterized protein LOC124696835 [Lolium rigidum]
MFNLPVGIISCYLDDTTTVDPSYTISLIRKLIPKGSHLEKDFSNKSSSSDDGESTLPEYEDQWEECGCILWDLAASEPQAEHMIDNAVLEVLLENLRVADSSRVKEVCLGIMGNLACHESLVDAICLEKGLITTVVNQLFLDDVKCLSETFRLLAAILRSSASVSWAEVLLPDEILSRMLWIIGNTMNSTLLEKSIDFISTVISVQDALVQPLLKAGLVDHVVGLLTTEIEKSPEEKLDRPGSLDMILRFMEELSAIHSVSEVMSSSDQLMKVLSGLIKSPDKHELLDDTTTVDPSYTISLIRKMFRSDKQRANSDDGEPSQPDNKNPSRRSDKQSSSCDDGDFAASEPVMLQAKKHHSYVNCPRAPWSTVAITFMFFVVMGYNVLACGSARPTCEVTSLATNIQQFCAGNQPTSSCCESLRAAAMSQGKRGCLCIVGSSPDVITIGFTPDNLVMLYAQCTEHDDGFTCEETVTDKQDHGKHMRQHDFEDNGHARDEREQDGRDRGEPMPRQKRQHDDQYDGRGHRKDQDRKHEVQDELYRSKNNEPEDKEARHQRQQQGDNGSTPYGYEPKSHGGSTIAILSGFVVLALSLVGVALGLRYQHRHGRNLRESLHLAATAVLPVLAAQARLAAPVDLAPRQPTPATPALVNGIPLPHVQGPPLAFFPGPVEVVSLLAYIVLDKMRRSLMA